MVQGEICERSVLQAVGGYSTRCGTRERMAMMMMMMMMMISVIYLLVGWLVGVVPSLLGCLVALLLLRRVLMVYFAHAC